VVLRAVNQNNHDFRWKSYHNFPLSARAVESYVFAACSGEFGTRSCRAANGRPYGFLPGTSKTKGGNHECKGQTVPADLSEKK